MSEEDKRDAVTAAVRANYEAQAEAMVLGDTGALGRLLAHGFTLTHMTGYLQSKQEWLDDIDGERMEYHGMDTIETVVAFDGETPVLTARTMTDATIWGMHGNWKLQLRIFYTLQDGLWVAAQTIASAW
jgi:hypothetical protein